MKPISKGTGKRVEDGPTLPYGATLSVFNAKEKYAHLKQTIVRCVKDGCHQPLGKVAYRLSVPSQEIDGVCYYGIGAEFCSEEHALHWLETEYDPETSVLITDGIPTEETRDVWIHAFRQADDYPEDTERSGKWLIWLSAQTIDRYWQAIHEAVEQGHLGGEAKVSTVASAPVKQGRPYVICVYTYDYADKADVMRIREELRKLGIRRAIPYKADEDTSAMRYGENYTPKYRA